MSWNNHIHQQNTGQQRKFEGLSEQHILYGFGSGWPWALRSAQMPPAGACTTRLGGEAGSKTSPTAPTPGWVLGTRESPGGSSEVKLHSPPTYSEMDGEWSSMYTLALALQEESKVKLEDHHRRWWLRVWREILLLPVSFRISIPCYNAVEG